MTYELRKNQGQFQKWQTTFKKKMYMRRNAKSLSQGPQKLPENAHVRNWRSKGHLAPLKGPTKFPEIPVSLERNPEVFRHPLL